MFYETLAEEKRNSLFKVMRALFEDEERYRAIGAKLTAPYGTISVGGGAFEQILKAECIGSYLRALRKGSTPQEALALAENERTAYVKNWNTSRGKDYVVHRALDAEQALLDTIHRRILSAVS